MIQAIEFTYTPSDIEDSICSHQFNKWIIKYTHYTSMGNICKIKIISIAATALELEDGSIIETLFVIYEDDN